ncbi:MAG TPA: aspartate aminotransferase family protein [Acidimicrobiia bacterium]|nr:aspartate aminotransferase family protein [Acidimicrobiia bacterium]
MGIQGEETAAWFERGKRSLVAGVSSWFRYWGDDDTLVIDRGEGSHVYDMDGKRYIDYHLGFGPVILGHGHPAVSAAVAEAAAGGTTFAMTSAREIQAAERFKEAVPWVDRLRFTNTGTEATMHAIRLARAITGRELILKFEGTYHGAHDYLAFSTAGADVSALGSRLSPIPVQASSGIPEAIRSLVRVAPFNDLEHLERLFRSDGHRLAAVIVEPALGNAFGILPKEGYLEGIRKLCDEYGVVLIFDEVKTGFRIAIGGAVEAFGVTPDLATFAKCMGNGFPVAAVAGTDDFIGAWEKGGIMQAGTYSGNGIAAAATLATLDEILTGEPLKRVEAVGRDLMDGIGSIAADAGVPVQPIGHPSMFGLFFGDEPPSEFRDAAGHDEELYGEVVMGLIRRGVLPVDDAKEPWFVSSAHSDEDVADSLQAFEDALTEAKG